MIIVTGASGQLGFDVVNELRKKNILCKGIGRAELDITNKDAVINFFDNEKPYAIIHCAAYNAVDKAENDADNCFAVNVSGTENIASAAKRINAKMMSFSSDYVFSGEKSGEYEVGDEKNPLSVYGKSKSDAEEKIKDILDDFFILRISWLFGKNGNNFVKKMLKLSETNSEISVVSDNIGSPTYTKDLATLICDMIYTEKYGIYHVTNEGFCSWAEFAAKIFELSGKETSVKGVLSMDYPQSAKRPLNSRLSKASIDKAGLTRLPDWKSGLERYLSEVEQKVWETERSL